MAIFGRTWVCRYVQVLSIHCLLIEGLVALVVAALRAFLCGPSRIEPCAMRFLFSALTHPSVALVLC
jgi:hypothetical protein